MIKGIMNRLGYEKRADSSYQESLLTLLTNQAGGSRAFATATAALESCVGTVGRAFAACQIHGPDYAVEALTPNVLSLIGRDLVRKGEIIFKLDVFDGRLRLWPATSYDIYGDRDPQNWRYRIDMAGPDIRITQEDAPADSVLHFTYAVEVERPWRGRGPISFAQLAGRLSAETAAALADEASGPRGSFLPMPGKDGQDSTTDALRSDIRSASGSMLTVESMASAWKSGEAPPGDWIQKRFGPSPPDGLVKLLGTASMEVMAACGLSPSLFLDGDGTGKREAWRQALFGTIMPLGKLVETELRKKLCSTDIKLSWSQLRASDLQARARSFKNMVEGGFTTEKAAALSGLLLPEDE